MRLHDRLLKAVAIIACALFLAALGGIVVSAQGEVIDKGGPWMWQEKCPTRQYEVRVSYREDVAIVSCFRMD